MDDHGSARRTARITLRAKLTPCAHAFVVAALASVACAAVADATILGRAMVVADTQDPVESTRTVTMTARESPTDLIAITDPRVGGATLTVVLAGATPSTQSFALDASGWSAVPQGYRYRMANDASGPPVRKVTMTLEPGGVARMRVVLRGDTGTDALLAVPPDPGTEGGVTLAIGSERYCARFGGPAGGTIRSDTATRWRIVRPLTEAGCLDPPPPVCGNGVIEGDETCDGSASPVCDAVFAANAECGAPGSSPACSCCYPSGTEYTAVSGADGFCCDGNEVPAPRTHATAVPACPTVTIACSARARAAAGKCFDADGLPAPVCGSCFDTGTPCIPGYPQVCCSGSCGENGLCD